MFIYHGLFRTVIHLCCPFYKLSTHCISKFLHFVQNVFIYISLLHREICYETRQQTLKMKADIQTSKEPDMSQLTLWCLRKTIKNIFGRQLFKIFSVLHLLIQNTQSLFISVYCKLCLHIICLLVVSADFSSSVVYLEFISLRLMSTVFT